MSHFMQEHFDITNVYYLWILSQQPRPKEDVIIETINILKNQKVERNLAPPNIDLRASQTTFDSLI